LLSLRPPPAAAPQRNARAQRAPRDGHGGRASGARQRRGCTARLGGGSPGSATDERLQGHIVSPAPTTERLQSIQRMVADQLGDAARLRGQCAACDPVQAGGLYPISDVWYIEPGLDVPDRLRVHIAQFAREIAGRSGGGRVHRGPTRHRLRLRGAGRGPGEGRCPGVRAVLTLLAR
jgi:hypothetical protein